MSETGSEIMARVNETASALSDVNGSATNGRPSGYEYPAPDALPQDYRPSEGSRGKVCTNFMRQKYLATALGMKSADVSPFERNDDGTTTLKDGRSTAKFTYENVWYWTVVCTTADARGQDVALVRKDACASLGVEYKTKPEKVQRATTGKTSATTAAIAELKAELAAANKRAEQREEMLLAMFQKLMATPAAPTPNGVPTAV